MIEISIYRAIEHPTICSEYLRGHAQVLLDFGINVLSSFSEAWFENEDVFVLIARNENKEIVGGIKIHRYNSIHPLPVVKGIVELAPEIQDIIDSDMPSESGEICGLWISKSAGRKGLANFLSRAAIAMCPMLAVKRVYGISSPFTLNMFLGMGYSIINEIGENGYFDYPTPEFKSAVVMIRDTNNLDLATNENQAKIYEIRKSMIYNSHETHNGVNSTIRYNLIL